MTPIPLGAIEFRPKCECGCGKLVGVYGKTNSRIGVQIGMPCRFLPNHKPKNDPAPRLWGKCRKQRNGCWVWTGLVNKSGYGTLFVNNKRQTDSRVAWELANKKSPGDKHVLHHCDNPLCINPEHLYLGTQLDNMRDCKARGRTRNGATGPLKANLAVLMRKAEKKDA